MLRADRPRVKLYVAIREQIEQLVSDRLLQ